MGVFRMHGCSAAMGKALPHGCLHKAGQCGSAACLPQAIASAQEPALAAIGARNPSPASDLEWYRSQRS
ncbi:hypothetical protein GCM10027046_06710 [Uliginosibacterium flavum]